MASVRTASRVRARERLVTSPRRSDQRLRFISAKQERRFFDREARRLFGVSGDEFTCKLRAGKFADICDSSRSADVRYVAMLSRAGQSER